MKETGAKHRPLLWLFHILALVPLALLVWGYFHNTLTVDPIREITHRTGRTALTFLILSLAITPVSEIFDWTAIKRLRRSLGVRRAGLLSSEDYYRSVMESIRRAIG